jgi:hypothetical protein
VLTKGCDVSEEHAASFCRVTELVQVDAVDVTGQIPLKPFCIIDVHTSTASPQHPLEPFNHPEDGDSAFYIMSEHLITVWC